MPPTATTLAIAVLGRAALAGVFAVLFALQPAIPAFVWWVRS